LLPFAEVFVVYTEAAKSNVFHLL